MSIQEVFKSLLLQSTKYYYAPNEAFLYVEHEHGWPVVPGVGDSTPLTTGSLAAVLELEHNRSATPSHPGLPEGFDEKILALNLPCKDGKEITLYTVRADTMAVPDFIIDWNERYHQGGWEIRDSIGEVGNIQAAIPNWYAGASTHLGIGTHGPAKRPRPVTDKRLEGLKFVFDEEFLEKLQPEEEVKPDVHVYILDTIPSPEQIQGAWENWGQTTTTLKPFKKILAPTSHSYPGTYKTQQATYFYVSALGQNFEQTHVHGHPILLQNSNDAYSHDYPMADHGLFVAGIIHTIAPQAKLFVMEVLNNYGVGTFQNLIAGFKKVAQLKHDNPEHMAIINCSFTLSFPTKGPKPKPKDPGFLEDGLHTGTLARATLKVFRRAVECIPGSKLILSAAGNDSQHGENDRRPARHLAITDLAVGVGALRKDRAGEASYTNRADSPPEDGFMVFGGDYDEDNSRDPNTGEYTDSGQGVISIFTGSLNINSGNHTEGQDVIDTGGLNTDVGSPPETPLNKNGYAEWAGTSFATPILAGTVAKVCLTLGKTPREALDGEIKGHSVEGGSEGSRRFEAVQQMVGS